MHNQTHSSNFGQIKLMQDELKLMDATIDTMLKERRVLPMEVWYAIFLIYDRTQEILNIANVQIKIRLLKLNYN